MGGVYCDVMQGGREMWEGFSVMMQYKLGGEVGGVMMQYKLGGKVGGV